MIRWIRKKLGYSDYISEDLQFVGTEKLCPIEPAPEACYRGGDGECGEDYSLEQLKEDLAADYGADWIEVRNALQKELSICIKKKQDDRAAAIRELFGLSDNEFYFEGKKFLS